MARGGVLRLQLPCRLLLLNESKPPALPLAARSVNERGLYDYLIINDNLDEAAGKLRAIASRALQGLEPEPGKVPESVFIEDVS